MNTLLASWSDNFMYAATAVFALAFLAHAAEWAFTRERRTAQVAAEKVQAMRAKVSVGAGASVDPDAGSVASADPASTGGSGLDPEAQAYWDQQHRVAMFSRIGIGLTILGTVLLGLGVVSRGFAAGRVPWSNMYEFATTGTFIIALAYLVLMPRFKFTWLGLPVTGFALVVMGISLVLLYTPVAGLIPALQSYWLVIHVSAAVTATGVFTIGALTSVLQIVKARQERRVIAGTTPARPGGGHGYLSRLPSAEAIDRVAYRLHAFAFPVWTFALIAGAIWAAEAWGRYWGWDPKETWMFITWVCYAAYLHARSTAGWRNKVSWVSLVAYGALLFNLIGVNVFLSGLHSYSGI